MYIFVTQELNVKLAELQEKTETGVKERQQQLEQMNEVIQSLWLFYYVFLNFINHNVLFHFSYWRAPWSWLLWSLMFRLLHFHDREKLLARQMSPCSQNHLLLIMGTWRKIWICSFYHLFYRDGRLTFFILEFFKEFNKTTGDCLWGENGLRRKT